MSEEAPPYPSGVPEGRNTEGELLHALCSQNRTFSTRYDMSTWKELGAGRFGGVIKVYCRSRKEDVAVKVYYKTSPEERRRLSREATVSQRVHDAHVVRIHTPFEEPDLVWVEMEFVDGEDLQSYLSALPPEPLPFQPGAEEFTLRTLDIADAITRGVSAAAAANIIHRDIKAHNILLLREPPPVAKLVDFGLSKNQLGPMSDTGGNPGTPTTMAPELIDGGAADGRSDVYSYAHVLYALFTNDHNTFDMQRNPTGGTVQWAIAHKTARRIRARDFNDHLPKALDVLLHRGVALHPEHRPSLAEFAECLTQLRASLSRPAPVIGRKTASTVTLAAAAIAVLIVVAGAVAAQFTRRPDLPASASDVRSTLPEVTPGSLAPAELSVTRSVSTVAASPAPVQVSLAGASLNVSNTSPTDFSALDVAVTGTDGRSRRAHFGSPLARGQRLIVYFDQLEPNPPGDFNPRQVEVRAATHSGPMTSTVQIR
jgi:serine/threonine protein kinase